MINPFKRHTQAQQPDLGKLLSEFNQSLMLIADKELLIRNFIAKIKQLCAVENVYVFLLDAMILCPGGRILPIHLPARITNDPSTELPDDTETSLSPLRDTNAQAEKEMIIQALQKHNYNRTLTADSLHISRKTLFNKMKRYGIGSGN